MTPAITRSLIIFVICAAADAAAAMPSLEAVVAPARIELRATTTSAAHRRLLRRALSANNASAREYVLEFTDRTGLPSDWTLISELAARAAALLEEGSVTILEGEIAIEGTSPRDDEIGRLIDRLDAVRGPATAISTRIIGVSPTREPYDVLCRRQFFGLTRDNTVGFVQSGATLSGNALPALQRIAELLSDCPGLEVTITGHTDSLGDPDVNLAISLARAEAVVDYLVDLGLDGRRLSATGAGHADPLVPENQSGSRRINRRVEFSLRNAETDRSER